MTTQKIKDLIYSHPNYWQRVENIDPMFGSKAHTKSKGSDKIINEQTLLPILETLKSHTDKTKMHFEPQKCMKMKKCLFIQLMRLRIELSVR